jgi:hypothetical protein
MKRILIFGQPGPFGYRVCLHMAGRLARRLHLPVFGSDTEATDLPLKREGWIAIRWVGSLSPALLTAADTAIWLHYRPSAVSSAWFHARRPWKRAVRSGAPTLADVRDSFLHMAWSPHVRRVLDHASFSHVQVFHLRSPREADFWLHAQDQRREPPRATVQPV